MATAATIRPASDGTDLTGTLIKALPSLLEAFKGTQTTSTQQTQLSPEANSAILRQILGGSQGLTGVTSQGINSGLYNSSTNQAQVNDLLTKAAGEVAVRSAPTTVNTNKQPQASAGKTLLSLLGPIAAKKLLGSSSSSSSLDSFTSGIQNSFNNLMGIGGNSSAALPTSQATVDSLMGTGLDTAGASGSALTDAGLGSIDLLGAADSGVTGAAGTGALGETSLINSDIAAAGGTGAVATDAVGAGATEAGVGGSSVAGAGIGGAGLGASAALVLPFLGAALGIFGGDKGNNIVDGAFDSTGLFGDNGNADDYTPGTLDNARQVLLANTAAYRADGSGLTGSIFKGGPEASNTVQDPNDYFASMGSLLQNDPWSQNILAGYNARASDPNGMWSLFGVDNAG